MGAFVGLLGGLGLVLIFRSRTGPAAPLLGTLVGGWTERRRQLIRQAGIESVGPHQLLIAQIGCAAVLGLAVLVGTGSPSVALCFASFGFVALPGLVRRQRRTRIQAVRELWPDVVDNLASGVRAGLSIPDAVSALGVSAPTELRHNFRTFASTYRASGQFERCLDELKAELSDPVADAVCETVRIARDVGGTDLGSVLRSLADMLRVDARTRSELETRQSWTVNAARLAVAAPWVVLVLLGSQSTALTAFDTVAGSALLAIGAGACALAYWLMLRIARLPDPGRVLT
jgi:tight adherence protein B